MKKEYLDKLKELKQGYGEQHKPADAFCFFSKDTEMLNDVGMLCNHCDFSCDSENEFLEHMKVEHPDYINRREKKVIDTLKNGRIVKKFQLDNAEPHVRYAIDDYDGMIVGFVGVNCNYCSWTEVEQDDFDEGEKEKVETFHYKSNIQHKYLKVKIQELIDKGVPNRDVYAWLQENGKYSIRYKAEERVE